MLVYIPAPWILWDIECARQKMRGKWGKSKQLYIYIYIVFEGCSTRIGMIYVVLLEMQNIFQADAGMLPGVHRGNGKQTSCNYKTHQITSLIQNHQIQINPVQTYASHWKSSSRIWLKHVGHTLHLLPTSANQIKSFMASSTSSPDPCQPVSTSGIAAKHRTKARVVSSSLVNFYVAGGISHSCSYVRSLEVVPSMVPKNSKQIDRIAWIWM